MLPLSPNAQETSIDFTTQIDEAADTGTLLFQLYRRKIIRGIRWTPDDVIGLSPVEVPCLPRGANDCRVSTPFDEWCNAQYLSEQFGAAVLVAGSAEGIEAHVKNVITVPYVCGPGQELDS